MNKSTITREPITHDLKIYPELFSAVCTGVKRAELRKNDRDYRVGDTLHLMETPRGSCHQTGEFINVKITHIADVGEWMPGYVLLSIEREAMDREAAMDSEPVATLDVQSGRPDGNKFALVFSSAAHKLPDDVYFLYRHAQQTVVPDRSIFEKWWESRNGAPLDGWDSLRTNDGYCDDGIDSQFEAWSAAMLAPTPQEAK
ncbi:DUF3850 domain-containing protein [Klebsiella aerogenes]|uniref:DUF3850 domain-containing protein n=1 Tax=Klebsiella aerogenes TaxID=548 RepID=UPI0007E4A4BA|nr:DUF3850 domain-containing protein [Klebsiella aerogenes]